MTTPPRYSASERDRDLLQALAELLPVVVVERYVAVGSTSAKIPLNTRTRTRPAAVLLIDARLRSDQGGPLTLTPNYSFVWDSGSLTAQVYEPDGLVANESYRLTYLVIGG